MYQLLFIVRKKNKNIKLMWTRSQTIFIYGNDKADELEKKALKGYLLEKEFHITSIFKNKCFKENGNSLIRRESKIRYFLLLTLSYFFSPVLGISCLFVSKTTSTNIPLPLEVWRQSHDLMPQERFILKIHPYLRQTIIKAVSLLNYFYFHKY